MPIKAYIRKLFFKSRLCSWSGFISCSNFRINILGKDVLDLYGFYPLELRRTHGERGHILGTEILERSCLKFASQDCPGLLLFIRTLKSVPGAQIKEVAKEKEAGKTFRPFRTTPYYLNACSSFKLGTVKIQGLHLRLKRFRINSYR